MTLWVCYVRAGKEFDAQEEAEALGVACYVPRRVDMIRQGKRRRPDPVTRAFLPNYVFVEATDEEWHWLRGSKYLRTIRNITEAEARVVHRFLARVEADYQHRMAQIEAGQRVDEYNEGEALEIIAGPLAGMLATFRGIAEGAGIFPEIIAEAELMGQAVTVRLDPLAAKRAVA